MHGGRLNQWKENWESLRLLSTLYLGTLQCAIFYFSEWPQAQQPSALLSLPSSPLTDFFLLSLLLRVPPDCLTMTLESRNGEIVGDNTLHQVATQVTLATVIVVMLTFSYGT